MALIRCCIHVTAELIIVALITTYAPTYLHILLDLKHINKVRYSVAANHKKSEVCHNYFEWRWTHFKTQRVFSSSWHPDGLWGPRILLSRERRKVFVSSQDCRDVKLITHCHLVPKVPTPRLRNHSCRAS
jgi:hypothetical protein